MTETNLILTPKNIYRVLTSKQARRDLYMPGALDGLTLVGFWRDLLTDVLPQSALNTLLPADGSHPRVQSSLMNRTGPNSLPRLMREHLPLTQTGLVLLTRNAARFLLGRGYHPATFAAYMNSFEEGCTEADVFITAPVRDYLNSIRSFGAAVPEESSRRLVADAFRLAWLSLYALYGSEMNSDKLNHLRRDPENTFEIICSLVTELLKKTAVITGGNCVLYRAPLPS
ncbi:MAG: hypothetical protein MJ136_02085 [Clostridia bacterium]|nr:hypothetical protein [Clostridia bacterium]